MGKFALQLKAALENVDRLTVENESSISWGIKFKCSNCGEVNEKFNRMELNDKTPIPGSRGESNLVIKCKLCSRVNSADLIPGSVAPYTHDDSDQFKTIVMLECRGIEPVDCFLSTGFVVKSKSGASFSNVNLEEGEWVDYDEKSGESVSILDVTHHLVKS